MIALLRNGAFLAVAGVVGLTGGACQAQIMFSKINPGVLAPAKIELEPSHQPPMQRAIEYSRPALPNDRPFENDRIQPHHLFVAPITMPNTRFDDLRARTRIAPEAMHRETIAMESIQPQALERTIVGPRKLTPEPVAEFRPHADFDPQMEGFSKTTTRFDTSLYLLPRNPEETDRAAARSEARGSTPPRASRSLGW